MILQALNSYYERIASSPGNRDVPLLGFSRQKIHFCLVLNRDGDVVDVNDLRIADGKKARPTELIVPEPEIRTVAIAANFLWDNTGYALGADGKDKPDRLMKRFAAFREKQLSVASDLDDEGMKAVLKFLDKWDPQKAPELKSWGEMVGLNIVFRLDFDREYIHERPVVRERWVQFYMGESSDVSGMCLVTRPGWPHRKPASKDKGGLGRPNHGGIPDFLQPGRIHLLRKKLEFQRPGRRSRGFCLLHSAKLAAAK